MRSHPLLLGALLAPFALAQSPTFAPPVRLSAGDKLLGHNRLFPSPVFHDLDGNGTQDIVVGDLRGHLTLAARAPGTGPAVYAAETKVTAIDGKPLDFANW